jgi:hypothetical protein
MENEVLSFQNEVLSFKSEALSFKSGSMAQYFQPSISPYQTAE